MSTSAVQSRVFSAYRRLFRARKSLFQGDTVALQESRSAIQQGFRKNQHAPASEIDMLLHMVDEAEDMLRHGIVQGELNASTGHYGACVRELQIQLPRLIFSLTIFLCAGHGHVFMSLLVT
jgi:hypothetical protein